MTGMLTHIPNRVFDNVTDFTQTFNKKKFKTVFKYPRSI